MSHPELMEPEAGYTHHYHFKIFPSLDVISDDDQTERSTDRRQPDKSRYMLTRQIARMTNLKNFMQTSQKKLKIIQNKTKSTYIWETGTRR